jgi:hypothetical protein
MTARSSATRESNARLSEQLAGVQAGEPQRFGRFERGGVAVLPQFPLHHVFIAPADRIHEADPGRRSTMDADLLERLNEIFGRCLETELKLPWILWAVSPASGRTAVLRIHGAGKLAGDPGLEDFALPLTNIAVDQRNEILPARD